MEYLQYIIGILALMGLCMGWIGVQFLARKMKTKNHFDDLNSETCGSCICGGLECVKDSSTSDSDRTLKPRDRMMVINYN